MRRSAAPQCALRLQVGPFCTSSFTTSVPTSLPHSRTLETRRQTRCIPAPPRAPTAQYGPSSAGEAGLPLRRRAVVGNPGPCAESKQTSFRHTALQRVMSWESHRRTLLTRASPLDARSHGADSSCDTFGACFKTRPVSVLHRSRCVNGKSTCVKLLVSLRDMPRLPRLKNPAPPPPGTEKGIALWLENGFPPQMDVCCAEIAAEKKQSETDDRQERHRLLFSASASAVPMRREKHFTASAA